MDKLCECGCGKEVLKLSARFTQGHHARSKESKEKFKQICLIRFGETTNLKCKETKDKIKQTCLKKYGVESINQVQEIQKKKNQTCLKNYGVEHPYQSKEIQDKYKYSCIKHFGVDNYAKTFEARKLYRENMIRLIMNNYKDGSKFSPTKGLQEKECFNELQMICSYKLLEDQKIISYFPDRYIKELNIIIEFYEKWHKYPIWIKHDTLRQKDLIEHLNCKFFIIHEKNWKENKEKVIEQFKILINSI